MDQPRVDSSSNPEFIKVKNLKAILYPVEFLEALLPIYKQKRVVSKRQLLLSLMKNF